MGKKKKLVIGAVAAVAGAAGAVAVLKKSRLKRGASGGYRGNSRSQTVHRSGCRYFPVKNLARAFKSLKEATGAGYHPCKICLS